jgi:hypothetical protein
LCRQGTIDETVMKPKLALGSRAFWLRQLRQWHWISAAVCLIGMLVFAATGITLNHAAKIESKPVTETVTQILPPELLGQLKSLASAGNAALPAGVTDWLAQHTPARVAGRTPEWSAQEVYVALPRPGGDAWLSIDLTSGEARYERTDRGWVSYLNDLHKGRNTGLAWSLFLDAFAVACVVFCATGLVLLQLLSHARPSTWPLVGLGFAVPAMIAMFWIH